MKKLINEYGMTRFIQGLILREVFFFSSISLLSYVTSIEMNSEVREAIFNLPSYLFSTVGIEIGLGTFVLIGIVFLIFYYLVLQKKFKKINWSLYNLMNFIGITIIVYILCTYVLRGLILSEQTFITGFVFVYFQVYLVHQYFIKISRFVNSPFKGALAHEIK